VSTFFFGLMLGPANPFRLVSGIAPSDGPGPNPLLQDHPLVAFHPPMLYLGYVGFTIPFAFAIAALATGRLGEGWLIETRRWTLFAWGFLTVGIVLGAWWSYEVLGWGGYWAWDPVENASFLPWLTGTAYLHSVMVQERRGMLRVWNLSLLIATFSLTILGTFLTRSGVLDSVHAFSESGIGPAILGFFALIVLVGIGLIGWRGDKLRSPGTIDSPISREGAFLPRQQRAVRRLRVRGAPRHGVPAHRRSVEQPADLGRKPVLQPHDRSGGLRPVVSHGGRSSPAMAQGLG
jgi:cytochrome c-type biogenesis protein CcmF